MPTLGARRLLLAVVLALPVMVSCAPAEEPRTTGGAAATGGVSPTPTTALSHPLADRTPGPETSSPPASPTALTSAEATVTAPITAAPLLWLVVEPTFFCETDFTRFPVLVVYTDGTTLTSDGIGAGCQALPRVRRGHADPARVRRLVDAYFSSAVARVKIDALDVYDAAFQVLTVVSAEGREVKRVYDVGESHFAIPAEQVPARAAFAALTAALREEVQDVGPWVPDRLSVVRRDLRGEPDGAVDPGSPAVWPAPLTDRWRTFLDPARTPNGDECLGLSDAKVASVLARHGHRLAKAWWNVPGRSGQILLRLGFAVPGWSPCRTP